MMTRKLWILMLAMFLLLWPLGGCSIITPSDRIVIDQHYGNAVAINEQVQADPALPDYVKRWWAAEARTWRYMSDWAHGRKPIDGGDTP